MLPANRIHVKWWRGLAVVGKKKVLVLLAPDYFFFIFNLFWGYKYLQTIVVYNMSDRICTLEVSLHITVNTFPDT